MYQVTFYNQTQAKFTSLKSAYLAIEQDWGGSNSKPLSSIRSRIKSIGAATVQFCLDESITALIEEL